jgi:hypothetical protein
MEMQQFNMPTNMIFHHKIVIRIVLVYYIDLLLANYNLTWYKKSTGTCYTLCHGQSTTASIIAHNGGGRRDGKKRVAFGKLQQEFRSIEFN